MKAVLKRARGGLGPAVRRLDAINRFDAVPQVLDRLARAGFTPNLIVDVGANVGGWARQARAAFPAARIICEVTYYDVNRDGHPLLKDVVACMDRRGFELFDVVGLAARSRDGRLRSGDVVFVHKDHPLAADVAWA